MDRDESLDTKEWLQCFKKPASLTALLKCYLSLLKELMKTIEVLKSLTQSCTIILLHVCPQLFRDQQVSIFQTSMRNQMIFESLISKEIAIINRSYFPTAKKDIISNLININVLRTLTVNLTKIKVHLTGITIVFVHKDIPHDQFQV
jgi:hypothetical protein